MIVKAVSTPGVSAGTPVPARVAVVAVTQTCVVCDATIWTCAGSPAGLLSSAGAMGHAGTM